MQTSRIGSIYGTRSRAFCDNAVWAGIDRDFLGWRQQGEEAWRKPTNPKSHFAVMRSVLLHDPSLYSTASACRPRNEIACSQDLESLR